MKETKDRKQYFKDYYAKNKTRLQNYAKSYYQSKKEDFHNYYESRKDDVLEYYADYHQTKEGRAKNLLNAYKQSDKHYNRGDSTITEDFILNHIFTNTCHYCGESDWTKLGCDRIDNNLPHTPDNVVCCCHRCNQKRGSKLYNDFKQLITDGTEQDNS